MNSYIFFTLKNLILSHLKHIYFKHLFGSCSSLTFNRAKALRARSTEAEEKLWQCLRNRKINGKKFRRQHPLSGFILDFYCHECGLAIELDGHHHSRAEIKEFDEARTQLMNLHGITVLRFWNNEVLNKTEEVIEKIKAQLV